MSFVLVLELAKCLSGAKDNDNRRDPKGFVAQVSNLLYRRLPACVASRASSRCAALEAKPSRLEIGDTTGWKPALRRSLWSV
ncbi:MAG: hypothetical protein AB1705_19870, partial [Verrucomicrobiota bacterium]